MARADHTTRRTLATHPPRFFNRLVLDVLRSPLHAVLDPGICELRFDGRRSGHTIALPVMYAEYGGSLLVVVGDADDKQWWRNFLEPRTVRVRLRGRVRSATSRVVAATDPSYDDAWQAYLDRQHVTHESSDQILLITFAEPGVSGDRNR